MADDEDDDDKHEKGGVRRDDPSSSVEAAEQVPVSKLERMFIEAVRAKRPVPMSTTCIANYYGYDRDSFSPRAVRLLEKREIALWPVKIPVVNSGGKTHKMLAYVLPEDLPAQPDLISPEEMDEVLRSYEMHKPILDE